MSCSSLHKKDQGWETMKWDITTGSKQHFVIKTFVQDNRENEMTCSVTMRSFPILAPYIKEEFIALIYYCSLIYSSSLNVTFSLIARYAPAYIPLFRQFSIITIKKCMLQHGLLFRRISPTFYVILLWPTKFFLSSWIPHLQCVQRLFGVDILYMCL